MLSIAPLYHKHVRPETVVDLSFFPRWREKVTTGKGLIVPLDQLKLFVSKSGSLIMDELN